MSQCTKKLRIVSGKNYFRVGVLRCPVRLNRNKNVIPFLGLPDKMQNNTNTNIAWDIFLVQNYLLLISNSNLTQHPAFLFAKSGSLPDSLSLRGTPAHPPTPAAAWSGPETPVGGLGQWAGNSCLSKPLEDTPNVGLAPQNASPGPRADGPLHAHSFISAQDGSHPQNVSSTLQFKTRRSTGSFEVILRRPASSPEPTTQ